MWDATAAAAGWTSTAAWNALQPINIMKDKLEIWYGFFFFLFTFFYFFQDFFLLLQDTLMIQYG